MTFTYFQVGLPVVDEPLRTKHDHWTQGQYPLRRWVRFTLLESDKLTLNAKLELTAPELFKIDCATIGEADKAFRVALGFSPAKTPERNQPLVALTITDPTQ